MIGTTSHWVVLPHNVDAPDVEVHKIYVKIVSGLHYEAENYRLATPGSSKEDQNHVRLVLDTLGQLMFDIELLSSDKICWQSCLIQFRAFRTNLALRAMPGGLECFLLAIYETFPPQAKDQVTFNKLAISALFQTCSWRIMLLIISYLPTPPLGQDMTQGQFFKRSLTGLNSEFSFS